MAENRGKKFEQVIKNSFLKVPGVSIDRIHDQTTGYRGSQNICDFIVYKKPYEYYIECKSIHKNVLSISSIPKKGADGKLHGFYGNITDTQWEGMLEKSKIEGVKAGVICWWVCQDVTAFIPIQVLYEMRRLGWQSVRYDMDDYLYKIPGQKRRVYFDYDMRQFFKEVK